ncbi:HelD family protein [Kitasatospora kifunensis]|uniref:DNA helicase IV n=1 Tax=Kitasatospora kifunensis TaxID=58351 RepID=A0A7W7VUD4_KITKI|nr:UvrD-helicase domain-containing protein [Kitasatospora kifunensis]MBB4922544.1 DNA helicase IV [Kitasatospora kifunensis]
MEQAYVTTLYTHLDRLRAHLAARLDQTLSQVSTGHQTLTERETAAAEYAEQLARANAVEYGLCFGRLDLTDGQVRYIGRLGLREESADEPLLIDWRAPAARPFYVATGFAPEGVWRRRHLSTEGRRVVDLRDEVLDLTDPRRPTGEAALLAALNATRTGRMSDIVATVQAEQDQVIRADHHGTLVVQGGPGTGKTAVALHRAAYLLYTRRELLAKRVVLIIGPNAAFLHYIGQVLPSLGETGVRLATIGELYPGVSADRAEPAAAAELKGRPVMVDVLAAAVRDRQWVPGWAPEEALEVVFEGEVLRLTRPVCAGARGAARDTGLTHNQARPFLVELIVDALARQYADLIGADPFGGENLLDEESIATIREELRASSQVRQAIDRLWPALTPQRLLTDLFGSVERLVTAAPQLTAAERQALWRAPGGGWSTADVPLLDEAAELLGPDEQARQAHEAHQERAYRRRLTYARGVLDLAYGSRSVDLEDGEEAELLSAFDLVDAERLAERHETPDHRTAAERAAADRGWVYGHLIVDEAQDLSALAWRMLMRRCPSRSMTLVGDLAQTGEPGGADSWQSALGPYLGDRWRLAKLEVNYRSSTEIAAVAADVLAALDPRLEAPRPVRATGVRPWRLRLADDARYAQALATPVAREVADGGLVAVLAPSTATDEIRKELSSEISVLTVRQAKGLEFDSVIVADPAGIVAESPRGLNDLYVALTRATQRLGVVHLGELPAPLRAERFDQLSPDD